MNNQPTPNYTQTTFGQITKKLVNGGTPSTEIAHFWNGKIPWITGADFTTNGISEFRRFVSETAIAQTATNLIDQGQLLLVTRTGVGKLAIAPCDIAISQDITGVYPDTEKVDVRFLYHRMRLGVEDLKKLNQGTSINGIIRSDLFAYPIQLPALPQQRRIAEILSTLDDAIAQTEALIAKHQQIKAGLMHDLFTRGVTPDGHLRPTREQAPDLYKESPLGWIPKEWDVKHINSLATRVGSGITPTGGSDVYLAEGIIFIRSQNVTHEGLDLSDVAFIDGKTHRGMAASELFPFDVLLNITGASIGRCCYLPDGLGPANTNQHVCCIRIEKPNEADAKFLSAVLSSPIGQNQIFRLNAGGNREGLNYHQLRSFVVPWPLQDERPRIVVRLNAIEGHISEERQLLAKLRQQKHGLMHDLLTGRVRVKLASTSQ